MKRVVLFGGGLAGRLAAERLVSGIPDAFSGMIWDHATGLPPDLPGLTLITPEQAPHMADALLCSGYGGILPAELLDLFSAGSWNAHPSLLPAYRGRHAIQWAIAEGEACMGVTVHRMTSRVDDGDIVMVEERSFPVERRLDDIAAELAGLAADLLLRLARRLVMDQPLELRPAPSKGPYWRRRTPDDGRIDWSLPTHLVLARVRAGNRDYPATTVAPDGASVVAIVDYLASSVPGTVLLSTDRGCLVATVDGVVWLVPDVPLAEGDVLHS